MAPKKKVATYEDIVNLPEHLIGEILEGELVVSPRPASPHAHAGSVAGADILGPFHRTPGGPGGPGGWWILDEPELHLHGDVVVPDLAGWRRERMPRLPSVAGFELAPDWVCEIMSPSTKRHDRGPKSRIYAREQVTHMWRIEPVEKSLQVFKLEGKRWVVVGEYGDDDRVRAEPFDAIEIDLSRWWIPAEPG